MKKLTAIGLALLMGSSSVFAIDYRAVDKRILTPTLELYQASNTTNSTINFGAKFEPANGVLYGTFYDKDPFINSHYLKNYDTIRERYPNEESMVLMYLEFGQNIQDQYYLQQSVKYAKEHNKIILVAWNTYGSTLDNAIMESPWFPVSDMSPEEYIKSTLDYLAGQDVDVLIRFGGEMNDGESGKIMPSGTDDPNGFIESFRTVSNIAKQYDNTAMVWSPNDIGPINKPFEMYYPGDEYVDWIGISTYPKKYFLDGKIVPNATDEKVFAAGKHATPIKKVEPIMEFMTEYNIQKPVIISETGDHHWIRYLNEDTTEWATHQMDKTYTEVLYKYPQIKAINYFNNSLSWENSHALHDNDAMRANYNELVSDELFIKEYGSTAPISYKQINSGMDIEVQPNMEFSAVAYYPEANDPGELMVRYKLDGNWLNETVHSPYRVYLTKEQFENGKELSMEILVNGNIKETKIISLH